MRYYRHVKIWPGECVNTPRPGPQKVEATVDTKKDTQTATRIKRAMNLVGNVEAHGDLYTVESSEGGFWYTVDLEGETCSCKDYQRREEACKHIYAVTIFRARQCKRTRKPRRCR